MSLYLDDGDVRLYHGDAIEQLRALPDGCVDMVATSPPFYGLRDYGTGRWEGGDPRHGHDRKPARNGRGGSGASGKQTVGAFPDDVPAKTCSCGAVYVDQQIGLEESPDEWVARLVAVFAEASRVLADHGTLWIECGDSYNAGTGAGRQGQSGQMADRAVVNARLGGNWVNPTGGRRVKATNTKVKDLIGQPFMLAFGLRDAGWYWRGCYPWHKPNAMPESAKDRCTTAHSYVLHFAKQARYHFDAEAIAEPAAWERWGDQTVPKYEGTATSTGWMQPRPKDELVAIGNRRTNGQKPRSDERRGFDNRLERADGLKHPRSVWTIPTQGYPEAHFATWPEALARKIILAACPEGGTVLDPFGGSGTTALVARKHGRKAVLIELNADYCALASKRLQQLSLLTEGAA